MTVKHSDDDATLYRRIAEGDQSARSIMTERHLGLVPKIAAYYAKRNRHLDMNDLLQEGRIGIVWALDRFDVDKGFRFSTYATHWIRHFIQRYVIENHSTSLSTSKKDTEEYLSKKLSDEDRNTYQSRCIDSVSIHSETGEGSTYEEIVSERTEQSVEEAACGSCEWLRVQEALFDDRVSAQQRIVVAMRFGVLGFSQHTISDVSKELGIPASRVTSIEQDTMQIVFTLMEDDDGDD